MRRRRIFKYVFEISLFFFLSYIVELLVNFILGKIFPYCTNAHSYFEKGNKYDISLHINLNILRKFMILCWATFIAALGRLRPAGHGLDSPDQTLFYTHSISNKQRSYLLPLIYDSHLQKKSFKHFSDPVDVIQKRAKN